FIGRRRQLIPQRRIERRQLVKGHQLGRRLPLSAGNPRYPQALEQRAACWYRGGEPAISGRQLAAPLLLQTRSLYPHPRTYGEPLGRALNQLQVVWAELGFHPLVPNGSLCLGLWALPFRFWSGWVGSEVPFHRGCRPQLQPGERRRHGFSFLGLFLLDAQ